jgi:uncharacterized membrane protein YkoI
MQVRRGQDRDKRKWTAPAPEKNRCCCENFPLIIFPSSSHDMLSTWPPNGPAPKETKPQNPQKNPQLKKTKMKKSPTPHSNSKSKTAILLAALMGTVFLGAAQADTNEVPLNSCPAAVQAAIESHKQGGKLDEIKLLTVEGRQLYVVDLDLAGQRDLKLHVTADGSVVKSREDISLSQAPPAVKSAAETLVPTGGRIEDVEKEVADGKTTYVVDIDVKNGADIKAVFAEDGTLISKRAD